MGAMAAIIGAVGGLTAIMGIITAMEAIPPITDQFTWSFWFQISVILLLAAIALAMGDRRSID